MPQEWLEVIRNHGGEMKETYGVPVEEIRDGIKHGVRKVNIDTDIRLAMTGAIRKQHGGETARVRSAQVPRGRAGRRRAASASSAIEAFGCAGQAAKIKPMSLEKMADRYRKGELNPIVN